MKGSVRRVHDALAAAGIEPRIVEFPAETRTASSAAEAIGTSVAQIVKSLVIVAGDEPVVVLTSGANRVDTARTAALVGARLERANGEQVRDATGYAIGGVAPIGYPRSVRMLIDRDLLQYAARGVPGCAFGPGAGDGRAGRGREGDMTPMAARLRPGSLDTIKTTNPTLP
jgi:prolyl-tRNA editing enzyme YbaK/EbsC (Cys-tRNA(Pro) deacylase)